MISTIVAMFALCHAGDTPVSDEGPLQFNNRADLDVDIKTFLFDMRRSSDDFLSDNGETATTAKAKVFKWAKRFPKDVRLLRQSIYNGRRICAETRVLSMLLERVEKRVTYFLAIVVRAFFHETIDLEDLKRRHSLHDHQNWVAWLGIFNDFKTQDTQDIRETILKCLAGMLDDEGTSTHIVIYSKQFNRVSQNNVAMSGSTM